MFKNLTEKMALKAKLIKGIYNIYAITEASFLALHITAALLTGYGIFWFVWISPFL